MLTNLKFLTKFQIPDHPYRILIIVGRGSGKTNVLMNLTKHQQADINKICLYVTDSFEPKYQLTEKKNRH